MESRTLVQLGRVAACLLAISLGITPSMVHWIDAETQAVLDGLVESLPATCVLLLTNYRPEYRHSWGSKTYYSQARIDPLPEASAAELLDALLGADHSIRPLPPLLIERTEGNPFFLEESVRSLVETRVLSGEPGRYRLVRPLGSIQTTAWTGSRRRGCRRPRRTGGRTDRGRRPGPPRG
jgi:predicted ATPase